MIERGIASQSALSRASGVPQPTINRILTGATGSPDLPTLQKLAAALSTTSSWIADGVGSDAGAVNEPLEIAVNLLRTICTSGFQRAAELREQADRIEEEMDKVQDAITAITTGLYPSAPKTSVR